MKTLKAIDYQRGKIFVDESAEIIHFSIHEHGDKIIAQYNLNLEGIPYVELEEDSSLEKAKQFALKYFADLKDKHPTGGNVSPELINLILETGVECGYKFGSKAQPKKYTEDDLRKAFEAGMHFIGEDKGSWDEFIQSLQPKIESVDVETEKVHRLNSDGEKIGLPVHESNKPITYQKDGRTYLKINKINYQS